ncbi:MAG TPA: hypothetical protein VK669_06685 [Candidatus Limnocylindrales bacterium]|nr:hypothetical protein [Candidatus Limnocylindrales bacterium]
MYRACTWPRSLVAAAFVAAALVLAACGAPPSTNRDDYVGEYVFMPRNTNPEDFASFVILKRDGTAVEVRFAQATGKITSTNTRWRLYASTSETVSIGSFAHPVEGSPSDIKLGINDDTDFYYEKVR